MTLALKLLLALVIAAAGLFGVSAYNAHYIDQGRADVQAKWDAAEKTRVAAEQKAMLERQQEERAKEQAMQRAHEQQEVERAQREQALENRAAALQRTNDGLRGTIARLDAASRERRAASASAAADVEADAAARARELLASCADEYRGMAASAAGLANQVIGLQEHIVIIQPEAAALLHAEAP